MDVYQLPSVLRLTGVTLKDHVLPEDTADSRLLEGCEAAAEEAPAYDKIPRTFTDLGSWPRATNLRCWACGFTFDGPPKFVPTHVRAVEQGLDVGVHGNFCTFNCAELWIETRLGADGRWRSQDNLWRAQANLCLVYFLFTGRQVLHIKPAPQRTELRQYGGELDEDAFWAELRRLDPVGGLRDHTPGSVVPERERVGVARAQLLERSGAGGARGPAFPDARSVWSLCGLGRRPGPEDEGPSPSSIETEGAERPAERLAKRPAELGLAPPALRGPGPLGGSAPGPLVAPASAQNAHPPALEDAELDELLAGYGV